MKEFREINETLDRCCQMSPRQPLLDKQFVLLTNSSSQPVDFALLIEDDPNQKDISTRKIFAPTAYRSKTYTSS